MNIVNPKEMVFGSDDFPFFNFFVIFLVQKHATFLGVQKPSKWLRLLVKSCANLYLCPPPRGGLAFWRLHSVGLGMGRMYGEYISMLYDHSLYVGLSPLPVIVEMKV